MRLVEIQERPNKENCRYIAENQRKKIKTNAKLVIVCKKAFQSSSTDVVVQPFAHFKLTAKKIRDKISSLLEQHQWKPHLP